MQLGVSVHHPTRLMHAPDRLFGAKPFISCNGPRRLCAGPQIWPAQVYTRLQEPPDPRSCPYSFGTQSKEAMGTRRYQTRASMLCHIMSRITQRGGRYCPSGSTTPSFSCAHGRGASRDEERFRAVSTDTGALRFRAPLVPQSRWGTRIGQILPLR